MPMPAARRGTSIRQKRLIVALTGATGSIYGVRILETLRAIGGWETHLVVSDAGALNAWYDHKLTRKDLAKLADVIHKVRRRLVLIVREAPLNLAHLRNMVQVTEMGGIVFPPVPAFYSHAKSVDDLVNHTVGRVLDLFGVEHDRIRRWQGMKEPP